MKNVLTAVFTLIIFIMFLGLFCGENEPAKELTPIEKCFSQWDGSAPTLTQEIKKYMNDPGSFEHIETRFRAEENIAILHTQYRGKNAFGGVVPAEMWAEMYIPDCSIIYMGEKPRE
jgi:hypothetical protein